MKSLNPVVARASPASLPQHTFATLDGLRGVAAIAVVLFHIPGLIGRQIIPHGYLAVDFFFLLSGFVLTFAYQRRLESGWSSSEFLRVRVARLYPLYVFALLLAFFVNRLQAGHGTAVGSLRTTLAELAVGLCFLPWLGAPGAALFPLNMPSWSVFTELMANVIHVTCYRRATAVRLMCGVVVGLCGTMAAAIWTGSFNFGAYSPVAVFALFRVLFSYSLGILLFRIWTKRKRRWNLSPGIIATLLVVVLAAPVPERWTLLYESLAILVLFPVLILAGASAQPARRYLRTFLLLGQSSYAVYVLQAPLFQLYTRTWAHVAGSSVETYQPWSGSLFLCLLVALALVIDKVYDVPVRAWLKIRLTTRT